MAADKVKTEMADSKFNIISYLAGMTGFVFDKDVLQRIALDCGVSEVTDYSELTREDKDRCMTELLKVHLYERYGTGYPRKREETDRVTTVARYTLRVAGVIRQEQESGHAILDLDRLRELTDGDLLKYRNVGKATIEVINKLKDNIKWIY